MLLDSKADVSAQDYDPDYDPRFTSKSFEERPYEHRTALHYAAQLGSVLAARLLLEEGAADPNGCDSRRQTPLHLCLELHGSDAELEVGSGVRTKDLSKRPDLNEKLGTLIGPRATDGTTARWPVCIDGLSSDGVLLKDENLVSLKDEMLELLLEKRSDVNASSLEMGEGRTALHQAAQSGDAALVKRLISARASVNQQDQKLGLSALHLAARGKHEDVVRSLVEGGAELDQKTATGKTALQLAQTNGANPSLLALLSHSEQESPLKAQTDLPAVKTGGLASLTAEQRAMLFID